MTGALELLSAQFASIPSAQPCWQDPVSKEELEEVKAMKATGCHSSADENCELKGTERHKVCLVYALYAFGVCTWCMHCMHLDALYALGQLRRFAERMLQLSPVSTTWSSRHPRLRQARHEGSVAFLSLMASASFLLLSIPFFGFLWILSQFLWILGLFFFGPLQIPSEFANL